MKDVANIFKLSPDELEKKRKSNRTLWNDTAPEIIKFAKDLQGLLKVVDTPYVIGLDGGYGTGKTHFATRFAVQIDSKIKTLYFSAWEKDYIAEPLNVFVEQIIWLVKKEQEVIDEQTKPIIARVIETWWKTTKFNLKFCCEKLPVSIDTDIKQFITEINNIGLTEDIFQEAKRSLAEYIKLLPKGKLVFIVDDLDRCRPDTAVKVLEIIKHFFDIEGLIVVLPTNQARMKLYIDAFYGIPVDAYQRLGNQEDYLRKFFNEIINIPSLNYEKICSDRINKKEFNKNLVYTGNDFNSIIELQKWIAEYAKKCGFSYRETVEIIKKAKIFCNNYNEPIRCRLLAYTLCNRLHKQKATKWAEQTDIQYGENDIYKNDQQNPRMRIFGSHPAHPELNQIRYAFSVPAEFDNLVALSAKMAQTYADLYKNIDDCIKKIAALTEYDFLNNKFYYDQAKPRLERLLPLLRQQKEDAEKLQKEHGSDDNDAERAKIYANLAKNPQLLKK